MCLCGCAVVVEETAKQHQECEGTKKIHLLDDNCNLSIFLLFIVVIYDQRRAFYFPVVVGLYSVE